MTYQPPWAFEFLVQIYLPRPIRLPQPLMPPLTIEEIILSVIRIIAMNPIKRPEPRRNIHFRKEIILLRIT